MSPSAPTRRPLPLYPYQESGARALAAMGSGLLLDPMGLGKTTTGIRASDLLNARRLLIVCPYAVKEHWRREIIRFGLTARRIDVVDGRKHRFDPRADTIIVNYDVVFAARIARALYAFQADTVLLDEAHFLKNPSAKRTKALFGPQCTGQGGIIEHARHRFALTGTPTPNHPGELWPLLRAIVPRTITPPGGRPLDYSAFVDRFCSVRDTRFGEQITGGRNLDQLRALIAPYVVRRRKQDVLPDLPTLRVELAYLAAGDAAAKIRAATAQIAGVDSIGRILGQHVVSDQDVLDALQEAAPFISTLRRYTGMLKAPLVADLIATDLDGGLDKIVVMAVHRDVIAALAHRLARYQPLTLDGSTPKGDRQRNIDLFQTDPRHRVFIGQMQAAGVGITLTAASDLVFAEQSFVPAEMAQAAMRVHRIGQTRSVLARIATVPGTIDEMISQTLRRKAKTISHLFG